MHIFKKMSSKDFVKALLFGTLFLSLLLPFIHLSFASTLILVIIFYIIITSFFYHKLGFFALVLIRPCLDTFSTLSILKIGNLSINLAAILGIFTIIFTIYIAGFVKQKKLAKLPLAFQIIIFLLITFFSVLLSINFRESIAEWIRLLNIFSLFVLGFLLTDNAKDLSKIVILAISSSIIPSIFATIQFFSKTGLSIPLEGIYNRIYGTFSHPNLFAYYLIIPIVLSLFKFLSGNKKRIPNLIALLIFLFLTTLLILTYTRGAWIVLIFIITIIGAFRYSYLLPILFSVIILAYLIVPPIQNRARALININEHSSVQWRINLWQDSLKIAKEKPILGFGTGVASQIIRERRGKEFGSSNPHNDYLKILLENGLLGLISYFILIMSIFLKLFVYFKKSDLPRFKALLLIMIAISFSLYIMSFGDNILRNTALQWNYWMLLGGIFAICKTK